MNFYFTMKKELLSRYFITSTSISTHDFVFYLRRENNLRRRFN